MYVLANPSQNIFLMYLNHYFLVSVSVLKNYIFKDTSKLLKDLIKKMCFL